MFHLVREGLVRDVSALKVLPSGSRYRFTAFDRRQCLDYDANFPIAQGPMISGGPPRYTTADQAARLQGVHMEQEEKSRKARAPTDLHLPDGIEETVLGDGVQQYKTLQEFERKLDATMTRMRSQIQDYLFHRPKYYRTLRIFIWNTVQNQPWQEDHPDANKYGFDASQPTYKVFINGRLLPDEDPIGGNNDDNSDFESDTAMDTDDQAKARAERKAAVEQKAAEDRNKPSPVHTRKSRMSHFFKAITVDMHRDSNDQRQGTDAPSTLEWKKPPPQPNAQTLADNADFDILSFERRSDGNTNCTFSFYLDDDPERFQLSPELASICDETVEDRNTVLWKVWEYVKAYGLLQDEEKKIVSCDELLRSVCYTLFAPMSKVYLMILIYFLGFQVRHNDLPPTIRHHPKSHVRPSPDHMPLHHPPRPRIRLNTQTGKLQHLRFPRLLPPSNPQNAIFPRAPRHPNAQGDPRLQRADRLVSSEDAG